MKWRQFHNINDLITSMPNNREAIFANSIMVITGAFREKHLPRLGSLLRVLLASRQEFDTAWPVADYALADPSAGSRTPNRDS